MSSNRLVIFSKSADPGQVKTRLKNVLTEERCLTLHVALLKDTLFKVRMHSPVLYLSGSGHLPFAPQVPVLSQKGADLGERLLNAFGNEMKTHRRVIVIGTDSPTFPEEQIANAAEALDSSDAVFGPCEDGGYYLIGLKILIPEIFTGISWGSSTVLEDTLGRMGKHSFQLLDTYYDIDTPRDLDRFKAEAANFEQLPNLSQWIEAERLKSAG